MEEGWHMDPEYFPDSVDDLLGRVSMLFCPMRRGLTKWQLAFPAQLDMDRAGVLHFALTDLDDEDAFLGFLQWSS